MGKKGREIVGGNVKQLIEELNKAYADEWIAFYYYTYAANMMEGINAPIIIGELKKVAKEELEHTQELSERIIQLGGKPTEDFDKLVKIANAPKVNLPKKSSDLEGFINAFIEAEREAIEVYNKMLQRLSSFEKDPITSHLIRHIMEEEVAHEETFENLLDK